MQTLTLPSGGKLGFERIGRGDRKAFFFHGFPGSGLQARLLAPVCEEQGIEVVTFDRPGYGLSEGCLAESGLSATHGLVTALAGAQGWESFHLLAVSGGTPYAIHCALALGRRVRSLHVVCGLGPLRDPAFASALSREHYLKLRALDWIPGWILDPWVRRKLGGSKPILPGLGATDLEILQDPAIRPVLRAALEQAFAQGTRGAKTDLRNYFTPWSEGWERISCPAFFWHGSEDRILPWSGSERLASRIAGARFIRVENEGHYSLPVRHAREILSRLG